MKNYNNWLVDDLLENGNNQVVIDDDVFEYNPKTKKVERYWYI